MAKGWYLMDSKRGYFGDYDDNVGEDMTDIFDQALGLYPAIDVELYNYDLSEKRTIKAYITHRIEDTKLKTLTRHMMVKIGTCRAGMYVKYKNLFWLITGLVDDNSVYEKAILSICNYKLSWLNPAGEIITRWANITSASQYNSGETWTDHYTIRSDQLMILLPDDDESLMIDQGYRFVIDKRCEIYEKSFSSNVTQDTSKPIRVYKCTRGDTVLHSYVHSGHMEFMTHQDEQAEDDGYYVVNGHGYWLCGKPGVTKEERQGTKASEIDGQDFIYNGIEPGIFFAKFYGYNGNEEEALPEWDIDCDFLDQLQIVEADNGISIFVDNKKLIGKSFRLTVFADGYNPCMKEIAIKAFF